MCLDLKKFAKSYLRNGRIIKDTDGCLVPKKYLTSPTYRVDGSPRTLTGALVTKNLLSYLLGGRIIKETDGCIGLEFFFLSPTLGVDGSPRTPMGAVGLKSLRSPTYGVDGS